MERKEEMWEQKGQGRDFVTIQQMRYLMEVIDAGSISGAAERQYSAQSTISTAIQNIEEEYGFPVFIRSSRGMILTEQGERLAMDVKCILQQVDLLETKYMANAEHRLQFSVATQHHLPGIDALCLLIRQHLHEQCSINFFELRTSQVLEAVSAGQFDVGIFSLSSKTFMIQKLRSMRLVFHHLAYKPVHIYVRKGHPLAGRASVEEEDLEGFPRISYDRSVDTDTLFTDVMDLHSSCLINVTDRAAAYTMLQELDGFLIASGYRTDMERQSGIVSLPLEGQEPWEVGYVLHAKAGKTELLEEFLACFKKELGKK